MQVFAVEVRHINSWFVERIVVKVSKEGEESFYEVPDRAPSIWLSVSDLCVNLLERTEDTVASCKLNQTSRVWGGAILVRYDQNGLEVLQFPGKGLAKKFFRYYNYNPS